MISFRKIIKQIIGPAAIVLIPAVAMAQDRECRILCAPTVLFEPTITIENLARAPRVSEDGATPEQEQRQTIFESVVALDVPTKLPRLSFTFEAILHPFVKTDENPFTGRTSSDLGGTIRDNPIEIESEANFHWLLSEQTGGWVSSHFDVVDQFSPSKRPTDRSVYTHKLDFELDTTVAIFAKLLPKTNWFRNVEVELSLDYLAGGLPRSGDQLQGTTYLDDASPWSLSLVFAIPLFHPE